MERKRKLAPTNPWGLSYGECKALEMLALHGDQTKVAGLVHRSMKTIACQLGRAREKMGANNTILAVIAWDRAVRSGEVSP